MFGLSPKAFQMICSAFEQIPEIEEVLMFGSRAMNTHKQGSDVDLALKGAKVTADTVAKINQILAGELPLPYLFDVVAYHSISNQELKQHIDQYGKSFYLRKHH